MNSITSAAYFAVLISLALYQLGAFLKKKCRSGLINPLLIAIAGTIVVLIASGLEYDAYAAAAKPLSYLLTPATVCLAIPLYKRLSLLRRHYKAVIAGIALGVATSLLGVLLIALVFGLDHSQYVTLLPKSVTTAIGMDISAINGGVVTITVAVIILTGIVGSVIAEPVCRIMKITDPVAQGVGIGSASHAIGTSRAMEMSDIAGAMSGLSIAVAGLMTVVLAAVFSNII
jgi:putative effector of murein hydrolase